MRGFERFFMDLVQDQALAGAILDKALEIKLRFWETVFGQIGDILDVIYDADDYGSQMAPLIAPDLWRKMIKPRISELYAFVHANSRAKVFLHSDGAIKSLIPDLIEAGVDGLNPVQFTAEGMDLPELKREFGREIAFWGGGVDTQKVLPRGTPEEVRAQVLRNVETLMPGGGYIFATVHNIQADVPPENIVAMVEALREAGRLPLDCSPGSCLRGNGLANRVPAGDEGIAEVLHGPELLEVGDAQRHRCPWPAGSRRMR